MTDIKAPEPAAAPGAGARLVSNSRWNLIAFGVSLVVNFATIPVVVAHIGLDAFGAAGLVIAIYAPFMLVGTVLGQAMIRQLSPLLAGPDPAGAAPILSAGLFLCATGSIAVIAALTLAGESAVRLVSPQAGAAVNWPMAFLVAGLGWAAQQAAMVLQATIAATQNYSSLAVITIVAAVASAGSILAGSILTPGYMGFLVGTSAGFAVSLLLWIAFVWRRLPALWPLRGFGTADMRGIADFGKWQGAAHFAGAIGNQIDRYVLGVLAPMAVVGQYNVAMRLQEVVHMGLLKATEVLFPHFTVTADDPLARRADFFIQASWIANVLGVAALAPLIPLGADLIALWINQEAANGGGQMLRTLAAAGVLGCGVNVYYYFAIGTGQSARIAGLTGAHAVLTVVFTIVAIQTFGPLAAGAGYLVANAIRLLVTLQFTSRHFAAAAISARLAQCTLPPLAAGLALAIAMWQADWFSPDGWLQLLASYAATGAAVGCAAVAATCLSRSGRALAGSTASAMRRILARGT